MCEKSDHLFWYLSFPFVVIISFQKWHSKDEVYVECMAHPLPIGTVWLWAELDLKVELIDIGFEVTPSEDLFGEVHHWTSEIIISDGFTWRQVSIEFSGPDLNDYAHCLWF